MQLILIAILVCSTFASQYVPIQTQYDGISFGNTAAKLHIEAFYDVLCPDSKASNIVFNKVFATTNTSTYHFTYHMFPLPYHINSFAVTMGVRYFADKFGDTAAINYINFVFGWQDNLSQSATASLTHDQIIDQFAQQVYENFLGTSVAFSKKEFIVALNDRNNDLNTRASWKYGCSRSIAGTPIFLVNGVVVDGAENWGYDEWKFFIDYRTSGESKPILNLRFNSL